MKKLHALVLAVIMLLSFTACQTTQQNDGKKDTKYVVGICQLVPHDALDISTKGFIDALTAELGDEVSFITEMGGGDTATCAPIISDFIAKEVDLILANATPALQAAQAATGDIPILGTSVTEYGVALGLQDFSGVAGGNISGTSDLAALDQQAAMVKEWFPNAKNVGLLYCSAEPNSKYQVQTVKAELETLGYTCKLYAFTDTNDMLSVTQEAVDASDVIYIPTDNTVAAAGEIVDSICRPEKIPVISGEENACAVFGVATLTIDYYDMGVTTGKMAARILKGEEDISTIEIEYAPATKKYNKEICDELGLTPPEGYIAIGE